MAVKMVVTMVDMSADKMVEMMVVMKVA